MEAFDVSLNEAIGNNSVFDPEKVVHDNVKELFAKTALLVMATLKAKETDVYDMILKGEKLFLLKATEFDFTTRDFSEFTDTDFKILEMNDESVGMFENASRELGKEMGTEDIGDGVAATFRSVYERMKKLRDESPRGQFPIFFMYSMPNDDESFKLISDGLLIDNSEGGFDKSVNALIQQFGDNFAEIY